MIEGISAFFQVLNRLLAIMERIGKWSKEHNLNQWINELEASIDKLEKAQTPEDKLGAAKSLVESIRSIK